MSFDIEKETAAAVSGAIENLQPVEEPTKKRAGRPKKIEGDGRVFSLWLPDETISELKKYAKKYGLTVSDLVRLAISCLLDGCEQKEKNAHTDPVEDLDQESVKEETPAPAPAPAQKIPQPNISQVRHF